MWKFDVYSSALLSTCFAMMWPLDWDLIVPTLRTRQPVPAGNRQGLHAAALPLLWRGNAGECNWGWEQRRPYKRKWALLAHHEPPFTVDNPHLLDITFSGVWGDGELTSEQRMHFSPPQQSPTPMCTKDHHWPCARHIKRYVHNLVWFLSK